MKLMTGGALSDEENIIISTEQDFKYLDYSFEDYLKLSDKNPFTECISKLYQRPVEKPVE